MPKTTFNNFDKAKQQKFLDSAIDVFLANTYAITMNDLIEALAISPATFYRYFTDKEDLALYILEHHAQSDAARKPVRKDLLYRPLYSEITEENFDAYTRKANKFFHILPDTIVHKFYFGDTKDRLMEKYRQEIQRLKYSGELREDVDPELISYMYATSLYNFEMYCRETGITGDDELMWKMKKYLYFSFFKHGILRLDDQEDDQKESTEC